MIRIARGSNPTVSIRFDGLTLVPRYTETIGGSSVTNVSYVTIRRDPLETGEITADDELQLYMDNSGTSATKETTKAKFSISGDTATVRLHRAYTKELAYGEDPDEPMYFLQFFVIDDDGRLLPSRPLPFGVAIGLADMEEPE